MRGVGREPLLLGDVRLEAGEHGVEAVGEVTKLVLPALQLDPVGERPGRGLACGVGDARQRSEHPSGEEPPARRAEHEQERQRLSAALGAKASRRSERVGSGRAWAEARVVGHVTQEEHPHGCEEQCTGDHEESGIAEGELEADAQHQAPYPRSPASRPVSGAASIR